MCQHWACVTHRTQKQGFWEQNSSKWLLTCFYPLIQRHEFQAAVGLIPSGLGSRIWQYTSMSVSLDVLGRLQKWFLKKFKPTLWTENTGAYLQCSVKSPGFRVSLLLLTLEPWASYLIFESEVQLSHLKHDTILIPAS